MTLRKIVSGAQTGVDRGALDAALEAGFLCGGWCPKGRIAEDGAIPERYVLIEMTDGGYEARTRKNVVDSDGTVILYNGGLEGGTLLTKEYCDEHRKPHVLIDAATTEPPDAARQIARFVTRLHIATLNVAGPRASKWPGAHAYARETIARLLRSLDERRSA